MTLPSSQMMTPTWPNQDHGYRWTFIFTYSTRMHTLKKKKQYQYYHHHHHNLCLLHFCIYVMKAITLCWTVSVNVGVGTLSHTEQLLHEL